MLDILNRYAHGLVCIPTLLACHKRHLFQRLPAQFDHLVKQMHANSGHLQVAFRMLESLGWVQQDQPNYYIPTRHLTLIEHIPADITELLNFPFADYLAQTPDTLSLRLWIERSADRWQLDDDWLADFLDGLLLVPLLLALHQRGIITKGTIQLTLLPELVQTELQILFVRLRWLDSDYQVCKVGHFVFERVLILATTASYQPMLRQIDTLLFGNPHQVFCRSIESHEQHLDRTLNVVASGFQHDKFFTDIDRLILAIFNQPLTEQPNYVADMGSGDGTLLARVYHIIQTQSHRGQHLATHPLLMLGIDFNQQALDAADQTLANIPHQMLLGDIGDPVQLNNTLQKRGIPNDQVLHIRSFLDHDRPFIPPSQQDAIHSRHALPYSGVYVDADGKSIAPAVAVQGLVEHLQRWADILTSGQQLIVLEAHCLPPQLVGQYRDITENLHFDAFHAFSGQQLVEATVFVICAAEVGLLPQPDWAKRYPSVLPFSRISLNNFIKRPYRIRLASHEDLPLLASFAPCQPNIQRLDTHAIQTRINQFPMGQVVLIVADKPVAVLYTQRLATEASLDSSWQHQSSGSVIHYLGLYQQTKTSPNHIIQLLDFMQVYSHLHAGISSVSGLACCHAALSELDTQADKKSENVELQNNIAPSSIPSTFAISPAHETHPKIDVANQVQASICQLLDEEKHYDPNQSLLELGFDSLQLLELQTLLEHRLFIKLDANFFFRYTTPTAIIKQLTKI